MGIGSFRGVKCGQGVLLSTHPLLVPRSWKSRAIPLPTFWATPACNGNTLLFTRYLSECAFANSAGNESYTAQNGLLAQDSLPNVYIRVAVSIKESSGPADVGLQVRAMHRLKVWIYPLAICTMSDKHADQPAKRNMPHSTASTCCLC
jgi:hypothetical protein